MKKKTIFGTVMAVVIVCGVLLAASSKLQVKIVTVESHDFALDYLIDKWIAKTTPMGLPNEKWAHDEVRMNMVKCLNAWRKIANDPRKVWVSKTSDTQSYVITIRTADGSGVSLWLDSDGNIESMQPD